MDQHTFQVNLGGMIELLSEHLYSSRDVFVRELLQNGVDAITARQQLDPDHEGCVTLRVVEADDGRAQLIFEDDGVGLTPEETRSFLATIGSSSKREAIGAAREAFIGQFGIGLLSCFMVCDELLVVTRSARTPDAPLVVWRGRADGTYTTEVMDGEGTAPGTQVYLSCKEGCEEYFTVARVTVLAQKYGGLLPFPVRVEAGEHVERVSASPPWSRTFDSEEARHEAYVAFGESCFGQEFLGYVPLRSATGKAEGIAYILPHSPSPGARASHHVYLKHMFLGGAVEGVLPSWAFFVKAVLNADALRPTASREAFYEDEVLEQTREELGASLRAYLVMLREHAPQQLERFIQLHHDAIKNLAVYDDEFLELFVDWLPYETSLGRMTFGEFRERCGGVIRYAPTVDLFRQIAHIAASQQLGVLNAGYVFDVELLERLPRVLPQLRVVRVDPARMAEQFTDLDAEERQRARTLLRVVDEVLAPFSCRGEVKKFTPEEVPALYTTSAEMALIRDLEKSRDQASGHWADMLSNLIDPTDRSAMARLCLNYENPLVRKLARIEEPELLRMAVQTLYVQSLLLGHHPLNTREMALLNTGLLDWIEWGIAQHQWSLH